MTDNEIIKALECCMDDDCDNCPDTFGNCEHNAMRNALDLINRQKAEIERLKNLKIFERFINDKIHSKGYGCEYPTPEIRQEAFEEELGRLYDIATARVEAVKEFADRLQIRCIKQDGCLWSSDVGAELEEMLGED